MKELWGRCLLENGQSWPLGRRYDEVGRLLISIQFCDINHARRCPWRKSTSTTGAWPWSTLKRDKISDFDCSSVANTR
jgi:hypothetical protein